MPVKIYNRCQNNYKHFLTKLGISSFFFALIVVVGVLCVVCVCVCVCARVCKLSLSPIKPSLNFQQISKYDHLLSRALNSGPVSQNRITPQLCVWFPFAGGWKRKETTLFCFLLSMSFSANWASICFRYCHKSLSQ